MRLALEWLSCGIHGALYGDRGMSLCARAWMLRERRFWAAWVAVWDVLLGWYEPEHCRASYRRCKGN
jgi:hypothetical protein